MNKQKEAFTLVELIVVITILTILGTIAIMAFSGYSKNARDSARIADIGNMKKSLELWMLQSGTYPNPSSGTGITYSGSTVWQQGTFGDSVISTVGRLEKKPVDPLYDIEYTYSVINSKKEYQIGAVLEKDMASNNLILPQTYAAGAGEAYISGTYNGILTTVGTNPTYIIALPSIILTDVNSAELIGTTSRLVYEGKTNLPSSYKSTGLSMTGTEFTFTPTVVWSGSTITNLNNQTEFQNLVSNLQTAYKSDTNFASLPEYTSIVATNELSTTVMSFTKGVIETNTAQELTNINITPNFSCAANPGYINATYTLGLPTQLNQVWQNTNIANPCYYVCNSGFTGDDCHPDLYFSGSGTNITPWSKIDGLSGVSCQDYNLNATSKNDGLIRSSGTCGNGTQGCLSSGVYYIAPTGNESDKYPVYCDMNTDGGGWTLNMKFKSSNSILGYYSTYWSTSNLLNNSDFNILLDSDAKYKSFHDVSGNNIKFCMDNSGLKCVNKTYTGTLAAFTILPLSSQIGYTYGSTTLITDITNWISGLGFTSYDGSINCNGNEGYTLLKIGVVRNNELNCSSSDWGWGYGGYNGYSLQSMGAGLSTSWGNISKMGYIYVK